MLRREFLKSSILVVGGACLPIWTIGASAQVRQARTLILLELKGGNDGINTIVPYTDPAYQSARPGLAFKRGEVLHASDRLGFHKALAPLWPAWEAGELAWVLGLGYAAPNRSHFRSIEIWDTASASNEVLDTGWLAQLLKERTTDNPLPQGLVLGDGDPGPLLGEGVNVVSIQELEPFFSGSRRFEPGKPSRTTSAALHRILEVRSEVFGASSALRSRLDGAQDYAIDLPQSDLKAPLELLGRLLVSGASIPVVKLQLGGFDTHGRQLVRHQSLWRQVALSLAAFRASMRKHGLWDQIAIASYSEFGRRVGENGNKGTDHGTAAPHFVLGGAVRGGFIGDYPPLDDLVGGDLRHTTDFRSYYRGLSEGWLGLPVEPRLASSGRIDIFKSRQ